jgi:hypothetical protein
VYSTLDEALAGAGKALPLIKRKFGKKAGYVIVDDQGYVAATGA